MDGIEQPPAVSNDAVQKLKQRKQKEPDTDTFIKGILDGNRILLSKAITLIESNLPQHQDKAQQIIAACLPHSGHSLRIGITGVPGAGKSTFIEAFGLKLTAMGKKLAVLAVDPSSERTKGSILGDKTRMEQLSLHPNAYIRPSPSAGSLGGVARKTRETIILTEAAGFDTIIVETVGVGQSETTVHGMVDFFLLLLIAGAGDELQGIKRGIIEMSDAIVINKADGDNIQNARRAQAQYANALHLFPPTESGWVPKTGICSALSGDGIQEVWELINEYVGFTKENEYFYKRRMSQSVVNMRQSIQESLGELFYRHPLIQKELPALEKKLLASELSPYLAAQSLIEKWITVLSTK